MTRLLALFLTLLLPLQSFASVYPRSLTAENTIANTGKIQAGRNVQLVSTQGSISNNATVYTAASESGNYTSSFLQRVGEIFSGGDTTIVAKQDITNTGGNINAGNNANLIAQEGNVIIDSAELHNREEKRGKRHYILDDATTHVASTITAGNDVNIAAAKDVAVLGSMVTASGDANLQAGENLLIGAVQNEETHVTQYTKKSIQKTTSYKKETYDLTHQGAQINAGGNVNLASGGNMGIIGSSVTSGDDTNLATNGQLIVASTQDVHESHEEKKTKSTFVGKWLMDDAWGTFGSKDRKETHDIINTTQNGARLTAGQDLSTASGEDTTLIASHLKAGGAVNITTAPGASVNLLSAKNTEYESHTKSSKSTMWQAQSGSGHTSETNQMNTIESTSLNIDTDHINVDIARPTTPTPAADQSSIGAAISQVIQASETANAPPPNVQDIINSAATQPGMEYLNQLKSDPRVKWNEVNNAYEEWDYKAQGLTQEGAAIIAIAVTIATMGAGAAIAGAATTAGAAAGSAGAAAATAGAATAGTVAAAGAGSAFAAGTIGAAAANAAFSALAAQAAVTLVNNRGNIGQTFEDLASSNTVKSVAFAALTAGATQGLGNAAGLGGIAVPDMTIGQQATHIGINAGVSSSAQSLIYGEDFGSSLGRNLLTSTVAVAGAEASSAIGGTYKEARATSTTSTQDAFNYTAHKLAHAGLGCAMGAAMSGNCGAGAAAGVLAEITAEAYVQQQLKGGISLQEISQIEQTGNKIGELAGAAGGMVAGGDAEDIYLASSIGRNAAENNAVETLTDALMVLYDAGKIGYGYYVNDDGVIEEGFIDLAADGAALVVPFVPAGSTKLARAVKGADEVVETEKGVVKASKADILSENRSKGSEFEKETLDKLNNDTNAQNLGYDFSGQVTLETKSGTRTRVDIVGTDKSGGCKLVECKSSATAPLTKNQKSAFPEIEQTGATVVGKGKPNLPGGTKIPPTKIEIIRPE